MPEASDKTRQLEKHPLLERNKDRAKTLFGKTGHRLSGWMGDRRHTKFNRWVLVVADVADHGLHHGPARSPSTT